MVSMLCFLTTLAGPAGFYFENTSYIAVYPIDRTICPEIDPKLDITFELFNGIDTDQSEILVLNDERSVLESSLDFRKITVLYFHGFMEDSLHGSPDTVRKAYMQRDDHNFIVVNARRLLAGPWYLTAAKNTKAVGQYSAKMIDFLVALGMDLNRVHLIGHSLGGQSAGVTGHFILSGKVARITGLDPAKPFFENVPLESRLDPGDATFVDVIHTSANTFGLGQPLGHVDFYPNGGSATQPGCTKQEIFQRNPTSILEQVFCSHWRSYLFYTESVLNPNSFLSMFCDSWRNYLSGNCTSNHGYVHMGFGVPFNARGKFYLRTNRNEPYSQF